MFDFHRKLLDSSDYISHAVCGNWTPAEVMPHSVSDFFIWTAYLALPIVLIAVARKRQHELPFHHLFFLFGLFIVACSTTHLLDAILFYEPIYRLSGVVKMAPAVASSGTVLALIPILALAMRSPRELEKEISERKRAEEALRQTTAATQLLRSIATAANEAADFRMVLQFTLEQVCAYRQWPIGHAYMPTSDTVRSAADEPIRWRTTGIWHLEEPDRFALFRRATEAVDLKYGEGLPGRVSSSGRPAWIKDVAQDKAFSRARAARDVSVRAGLAFPVLAGNEVMAVLEFFSLEAEEPDESVLDVMAHIGTQLGRVAERERAAITLQAARDELETRVEQRTRELSEANARLQKEMNARESAQAVAQESAQRLQTIFDSALDALVVMDQEGIIVDWNSQAQATLGWTRDEAVGRRLSEVVIPERYRQAHEAGLAKFLESGEGPILNKRIEIEALHCDGHELPIELSVAPSVMDGQTLFSGFIRDITEKRQAESDLAQLLASEQEARAQAEAARRRSDFLSRATQELGASLNYDTTLNRVAQLVVPELADWCSVEILSNVGTDGTQLETQPPLHYRQVALAHVDPNKVAWAKALREQYPTDPNSPVGVPAVLRSGEAQILTEISADLLEATARDEEHLRLLREVDIRSVMIVPMKARGQILGAITFVSTAESDCHYGPEDLALAEELGRRAAIAVDNARLYQTAHEMRRQAETSSLAKSQFLTNMSHELRTPLNAIIGYSEMLGEEAETNSALATDLKRIHSAGLHLLALINDVLDLAKVDAGKMTLTWEEFSAKTLVEETLVDIQPQVAANNNALDIRVAPDAGTLYADRLKVRQALSNLLSNACKFTQNGTITVEVEREQRDGNHWVLFRVRDTGIGMTLEQQRRLFQPFTQADATTTREYGGTGLGLVITRRFCHLMGGEVTMHSELNSGSIFTIHLPAQTRADVQRQTGGHERGATEDAVMTGDAGNLRTETPSEGAQLSATPPASDQPATPPVILDPHRVVLVIDDDPTIHDLLRRMLARETLQVVSALSGLEGLQLARELHPAVITLDALMPGMDGWEVLAALKADAELSSIPVVMLTMLEDKSTGYAMGVADYMVKPVERNRLVQVLRRLRRQRALHMGGSAVEVATAREDKGDCGTVLLVEDDETTRKMVRRMLEKESCDVEEAISGREALEKMAQKRPTFILLDLMMPEMDGFDFCAELREHPEWSDIPVVVLTAMDITQEERQRLNGTVMQVIQKGRNANNLLDEVRALVLQHLR